jgi:hypothetical protein
MTKFKNLSETNLSIFIGGGCLVIPSLGISNGIQITKQSIKPVVPFKGTLQFITDTDIEESLLIQNGFKEALPDEFKDDINPSKKTSSKPKKSSKSESDSKEPIIKKDLEGDSDENLGGEGDNDDSDILRNFEDDGNPDITPDIE